MGLQLSYWLPLEVIIMALATKPVPPSRCTRCSGPMYRGYDDDFTCLFCGEYWFANPPQPLPAPPPVQEGPRKRGRPRKHPIVALAAAS